MGSLTRFPAVAMFLAGRAASWPDLQITGAELMALCDAEELSALVYERVTRGDSAGWPAAVRETLAARARRVATEEALRAAETTAVVSALVRAGIRPILIKGTALAYTCYTTPASRTRSDTDMLIALDQIDGARQALCGIGYTPTLYCQDLFSQFEVQKTDAFGLVHAVDVHWKISTQAVFADLLTYGEVLSRAVPVPALGEGAIAPCAVDALLLACVHPVMHHRNAERMLWVYDIHLLASHLAPHQFDEFAQLARGRKVGAICAHALRRSQETFGTRVPSGLVASLAATRGDEPSVVYLASERRWHHELGSSLRGTASLAGRARLLRQVLFPAPRYMLGSYGFRDTPLAWWLLPALYVHRNARGLWKIAVGKK